MNLGADPYFQLRDLLRYNLQTVRAYLLKEAFQQLWEYRPPHGQESSLTEWRRLILCCGIEPVKKIARSLHNHREPILNYFHARSVARTLVQP